ncbi:hypothetical protein AAVH_09809 [Aphelenchoides avenae]|nr:hypothetical protein AAVH_09809 [Aphelenchus avenae]
MSASGPDAVGFRTNFSSFASGIFDWDREFQVRAFGWLFLFSWISAVVYMTRDFWFPGMYRTPHFGDSDGGESLLETRAQWRELARQRQSLGGISHMVNWDSTDDERSISNV